jgi:ElaA protein
VSSGTSARVVHRSAWSALDPVTVHDLIALRLEIFVVEQNCPFQDLDGRDVEPDTEHLWTSDAAARPTSYLRVLTEPDGVLLIGRVCTRADSRGAGLAGLLVSDVLARHPHRVAILNAQERLAGWYGRFGFRADGPRFLEDGIWHLPMRLTPAS